MKIDKNCIVNGMPEDVYHNDPTPERADGFAEYTSLSSTVALAMIEETEIEARMKINRFYPDKVKESSSTAVNLGSIMHDKVLLGGDGKKIFEVIPYGDFRTKEAKMVRDDLISRGIIPLANNSKTEELIKNIRVMEQRLHEQLDNHIDFPNVMQSGVGEQSGFYYDEELGIWLRARFDWLDDKYSDIVWDYKTTSLSSEQWVNQELWKSKYIQCPHYIEVLSGIRKEKCKFAFVLQRTVEPFLAEIVVIDELFMIEVRKRYDIAKRKFANCLKTGVWRGASPYTIHSSPPAWIMGKWEAEELNYELTKERDEDNKDSIKPEEYINAG